MTLSRENLHALATSVYGPEWQSALARERGFAMRSVQRWAKDGIAKTGTAEAIAAYLLTRRIVDLPPPPVEDEQRDDEAHAAMAPVLDTIITAGRAVGWRDAELLAATLGVVVDRMIDGAGAPATLETLRDAVSQVRARIDA